jgi:hypothetical protein
MAKKKKKTLSDYVIKVRIDATTKKLTYTDEYQKVMSAKKVEWDCPYDYALQFAHDESPFTPKKIFHSAAKGTTPKKFTVKPHDGLPKDFKYSIAVFPGGDDGIIADDPQVIIDNSGGLGGKEPGQHGGAKKKSTKKKAAKRKTAKK